MTASRERLLVLISLTALGVVTFAPLGASAGPLVAGGMRIGPSLHVTPYADNLGGGLGAHTDRVWGHPDGGGTGQGAADCYRRTDQRRDKHELRRCRN